MDEQTTSESSMPSTEGEGIGGGKGMSTKLIIVLVVIVVLGGIYAWARPGREESGQVNEGASVQQAPAATPEAAPAPEAVTPVPATPAAESATLAPGTPPGAVEEKTVVPAGAMTVTHTDAGYAPQTVTIKKGATVTFKNESETATWPASAMHPTHAVYPTTGGCIGSTFDACQGLPKGETWSFKFDIVGAWKYHNHLNPTQFGTIIVTE